MTDPLEQYTVRPEVLQILTDYLYVVDQLRSHGITWDNSEFDLPGFLIANAPKPVEELDGDPAEADAS